MHSRTFERLQREHDAHVNAALIGMSAKLGLLHGRLEQIDAGMDRWRKASAKRSTPAQHSALPRAELPENCQKFAILGTSTAYKDKQPRGRST